MARRENVKLRATDKKVPSHSFLSLVCATVSWYFAGFFFLGGLASLPDYSSALCFSISAVLLPLKAWRVVLRKIGVYGLSKVVFAIALVLSLDRTFTPSFRISVVSFAALFSCYRTFRDRKREEPDELPDGDEESQAEHPLENSEEHFWSGDAKSDKRKVRTCEKIIFATMALVDNVV